MTNAKLILENHGGSRYIVIDGRPYVLDQKKKQEKVLKDDKIITVDLTPVNKIQYEKDINELVEKLAQKVDVKELMRQALFETPLNVIIQVKKDLKKRRKPELRLSEVVLNL